MVSRFRALIVAALGLVAGMLLLRRKGAANAPETRGTWRPAGD